MTPAPELLSWLNLLLLPVLGGVLSIHGRLTRLEALREADEAARRDDSRFWHRRANDQDNHQ